MPLWGKINQANNAPKYSSDDKGNTGVDQFDTTVFGVDDAEISALNGATHTGWVRRVLGTGPVTAVAITAGGTGYANTDTFEIESTNGANAEGTIGTNGSGVITSVTLTSGGDGFVGTETVTITTSGGANAAITPTFGGRAGRLINEVLIAGGIEQP